MLVLVWKDIFRTIYWAIIYGLVVVAIFITLFYSVIYNYGIGNNIDAINQYNQVKCNYLSINEYKDSLEIDSELILDLNKKLITALKGENTGTFFENDLGGKYVLWGCFGIYNKQINKTGKTIVLYSDDTVKAYAEDYAKKLGVNCQKMSYKTAFYTPSYKYSYIGGELADSIIIASDDYALIESKIGNIQYIMQLFEHMVWTNSSKKQLKDWKNTLDHLFESYDVINFVDVYPDVYKTLTKEKIMGKYYIISFVLLILLLIYKHMEFYKGFSKEYYISYLCGSTLKKVFLRIWIFSVFFGLCGYVSLLVFFKACYLLIRHVFELKMLMLLCFGFMILFSVVVSIIVFCKFIKEYKILE
jgi:hypothetical protein